MSEMLGRIAGLDLAGWLPSLSVWTAGAAAALLVVASLVSFSRAGRAGPVGVAARVALVLIGAGAAFIALEGWSTLGLTAERRALEARTQDLLLRAAMPGSAFACLDALAGDAVESACEKALFQTPEATAAALSYVAAELTLLADFTLHLRRAGSEAPVALMDLRRSIESDRFGFTARVLAVRDGCTPAACAAFTMLADPGRIAINLAERNYDLYVARHATAWPVGAKSPSSLAAAAPGADGEAQPPAASTPRAGLFFPSAASIPPVNIMNAEPALPPETTGSTPAPAPKQAPTPPRRPAAGAAASSGSAQPARPPIDLNAASRGAAPASTPQ